MILKPYQSTDCKEIIQLFYETVHTINAKDYTKQQLDAWAGTKIDAENWDRSLSQHLCVVAWEKGKIVGFGDMDDTGYLDRLYVHKSYQHQGIASAICDYLESAVQSPHFTTHASITAKPFFEKRGYQVLTKQVVERAGVQMINYKMVK